MIDTPTASGGPAAAGSPGPLETPQPREFFSAIVRGMDEGGEEFEEACPLDGHLDGDLYLRLARRVEVRAPLFVVLRLADALDGRAPSLRMAVSGRVGRTNPLPGGGFEVRVCVLECQPL